jgi:predicted dehydrogenase
VEKPGSHSAQESELIVAAARKHKRVMQMGAQRRSNAFIIEAFEQMHGGIIGPVHFAKAYLGNNRKSLGFGKLAPVPEWLNYELWQGPAPERPYRDNVVHYNWHWHWVWGGGEMDNNGSHMMDLARWGMRVGLPKRVTCLGGRYSFRDDQETPDTITTAYDFGDVGIALEVSDCNPRKPQPIPICAFYGANGSVLIRAESYSIYDYDGKELAGRVQKFDDVTHFRNFVETIRGKQKLNLEIAEGQQSALMCHLANIAYRSGQTIDFDPVTRKMTNAGPAAQALWNLEYRPGWEPKV